MSEFGTDSRALFGAARAGLEPTPVDRARVGRALGRRLGAAVITASASATATAGVAGAAGAGASTVAVVVKWAGIGLLVGVGAASGYVAVSGASSSARAPQVAASSLPAPSAAGSTAGSRLGAPAPNVTAPPAPSAGSTAAAPSEARERVALASPSTPVEQKPPGHVGEEAALLRQADEALRGGDANRALVLLREHSLRFPDGILAEERSAELVTTLCRLGRSAEARREAEQFLRTTPDSALAASVRASCVGLDATPEH